MTPYMQVHWMAANLDEARFIGKALLDQRLVACVQIEPGIESLFFWEGKIDSAQEVKVICKTKACHFSAIQAYISQESSYKIPQVVAITIAAGNSSYLDWLEETIY